MHSTVDAANVTMYSSIHEGASAAQHTDWQPLKRRPKAQRAGTVSG